MSRAANPDTDPNLMIPRSAYRQLQAKFGLAYEALERIASCDSYAPGDCPDIAKTALAAVKSQEQRP